MPRWVLRLLLFLVGAPVLLYASSAFIPGVELAGSWLSLARLGVVIGAANFFVLPFLRILLKPFILLTFGLISVPLNMAVLFAALRFVPTLEISGMLPLFWLSLLLGAFGAVLAFLTRG